MHDETPEGIATYDRALAFWKDQRNFSPVKRLNKVKKPKRAIGFNEGVYAAGMIGLFGGFGG